MSPPTRDWNQRYVEQNTPWDSGAPSDQLQRILEEQSIAPLRMLEIGCGTGTNAIFLAQQGFDVTAVDVSPLAIEQAQAKAQAADVPVDFRVVDLLQTGAVDELMVDGPYMFIFDRGVYHCLRRENLDGFLANMERLAAPGATYVLLAGNANDRKREEEGPPQVHAHELAEELLPLFELVELRECRFSGVVIEGEPVDPLAWAAVMRRRDA